LSLCIIGGIYASLAASRQLDLKRNIAFSSVSHMSFATSGIFSFTEIGIKGSLYLMLSHGFTSTALFFLIGVLSDRYHTRSVFAFSGLMASMPTFAFFLILMSLANVGFPGTSGFMPELMVLIGAASNLNGFSQYGFYLLVAGMFFTTVATLLVMLRLLFGHLKTLYTGSS
jgi:NADH-quinone oxidoreductase subunit M